jgi:tetratricopeptide (TPR) repeat protein
MDSVQQSRELDFNYSFSEATKQKILGNYSQAISYLYHCLELKPDNAATFYQLAEIFKDRNDFKRAIYFASKSVATEPQNIWYNYMLAKLYQYSGNIDSSIMVYKKIVKLEPRYMDHRFNLALLYLKTENLKQARKLLLKLKEEFGLNEEIAITLFQVYKVEKKDDKGLQILKEAITLFPDETRFYGLMAEEFVSLSKYDSALVYYNKLFAIDPDNEKGLFSLIEYYRIQKKFDKVIYHARRFINSEEFKVTDKLDILINLVSNQALLSGYSDSIQSLINLAIRLHSDESKFRTIAADFYIKNSRYPEAKQELIFLVENFPENYFIYEQLLYVLNSLTDYSSICNYSKLAISRFKDKSFFYLMLGISSFHLKRYEEAVNALTDGLQYTRNNRELNIQFYTYLGEAYNRLGDHSKSDYFFEVLLKLDPNNTYVLNNYSYYLALRKEKLNVAIKNMEHCLSIDSNSPHYLDTFGWLLFLNGRLEESKLQIEKALGLGGSDNSEILEHYIQILFKLGNKEDSYRYYLMLKEKHIPSNEIKLLFENE